MLGGGSSACQRGGRDRDTLVTAIQNESDQERTRLLLDLSKTLEDSERARLDEASARREVWRNPVLIAVSGGAVSLLTGVVLSFVEHSNGIRPEREQLALEMLREAVVEDRAKTLNKLQFLFDAGLLGEFGEDVVNSAELHQPAAAGAVAGGQRAAEPGGGVAEPGPIEPTAAPAPPPERVAAEPAPAVAGGQRVLQTSSHLDEATAQDFLAKHLGDAPGAWIMKRGPYWATVIPLVADARATRIVAELPDHVRQQGPFIRRLDIDCAGVVPLEGSGPAVGRECTQAETAKPPDGAGPGHSRRVTAARTCPSRRIRAGRGGAAALQAGQDQVGRTMFLSVFDIFKIGIGPSSSHTMGPMVAAARFLDTLRAAPFAPHGLRAHLHGSLAFTGVGHGTDRAVILGLAGFTPEEFDAEAAEAALAGIRAEGRVAPPGLPPLAFDPARDLRFVYDAPLPGHANGMILQATDAQGDVIAAETYYSIGGGFVLTEAELARGPDVAAAPSGCPYPFSTAAEMLAMARESGLSVAAMKRANELTRHRTAALDDGIARLWQVMGACIDRGLAQEGVLPGGLGVRRRAPAIHAALLEERGRNLAPPHQVNDWIAVYAMAVNEENAAGGQVVTAPTNGAAGVVPAVIRYWLDHVPGASRARLPDFLLTAAAIGGLIKTNASISGAEAGCQAEVGSASAMAAAGLAAALGGSPAQVENAAEIALEHHLGMTCDPVKGLVQVPCIERNGLGAIKAVSAASLALRGDGAHLVPLDACVETLRQTGRDMAEAYKETSLGGLAVNVPVC